MFVPAALVIGRLDPLVRNGDTVRPEAVLGHGKILQEVVLVFRCCDLALRIVALIHILVAWRLLDMNDGAATVGVILRLLGRYGCDHGWVVRTARFDLLDSRDMDKSLKIERHTGNV